MKTKQQNYTVVINA